MVALKSTVLRGIKEIAMIVFVIVFALFAENRNTSRAFDSFYWSKNVFRNLLDYAKT